MNFQDKRLRILIIGVVIILGVVAFRVKALLHDMLFDPDHIGDGGDKFFCFYGCGNVIWQP